MKMIHFRRISKIIICLLFCFEPVLAQESFVMEINNIGRNDVTFMPTNYSKALRASSKRMGKICVDTTECQTMPDSLKRCIDIASSIWEKYLDQDSLNIKIEYIDMQGVDSKVNMIYIYDPQTNLAYPHCLYRKLINSGGINNVDAIISINKNTDWTIGIGDNSLANKKNLVYELIRGYALSLGFGASLRLDNRGNVIFYSQGQNQITVFDKLVFAEDGTRLENMSSRRPTAFNTFAQGGNGPLYAAKHSNDYKLYVPTVFEENKSLKYLDNANSLMHYGNLGTRDLNIDGITLELLDSIGWAFDNNITENNIEIIGEGIAETGIASAYQSYQFHVTPSNVSNHEWTYKLRLKNGQYQTICTSTQSTFTIPAVINENLYYHDVEGDMVGLVCFNGTLAGVDVSSTYNLTLELKPHIISARIIETNPCDYDDSFYDAVLEVAYEGSHNLYLYLDQEDYDYRFTYYSNRPYYAQFHINGIDSWCNSEIHINAQNQYGSDDYVMYLPSWLDTSSPSRDSDVQPSKPIIREAKLVYDDFDWEAVEYINPRIETIIEAYDFDKIFAWTKVVEESYGGWVEELSLENLGNNRYKAYLPWNWECCVTLYSNMGKKWSEYSDTIVHIDLVEDSLILETYHNLIGSIQGINDCPTIEEFIKISNKILYLPSEMDKIEIINPNGIKVYQATNKSSADLSFLPKGIYIVKTKSDKLKTYKLSITSVH